MLAIRQLPTVECRSRSLLTGKLTPGLLDNVRYREAGPFVQPSSSSSPLIESVGKYHRGQAKRSLRERTGGQSAFSRMEGSGSPHQQKGQAAIIYDRTRSV